MENTLNRNKGVLLMPNVQLSEIFESEFMSSEFEYVTNNFCGRIIGSIEEINPDNILYLTGNIQLYNLHGIRNIIYVIGEFSINQEDTFRYRIITVGEVPINIHNVGVYFRNFFDDGIDYFNSIRNEHNFQTLTESNKPSVSFRTGIYLSNVEDINNERHFRLLRCSTNLCGPTDNLRNTDRNIIEKLNNKSQQFFEYGGGNFNHVLAQIYENSKTIVNGKAKIRKAKIAEHSDKTKDMIPDSNMAFCTFYDNHDSFNSGRFDHKKINVLTELKFRLKNPTDYPDMVRNFSVILYPNSVFMISLFTNRLYTHVIKPSHLDVDKIPVRMGYIVRCSKTKAVFVDNQTHIIDEFGNLIPLNPMSQEIQKNLKDLYYRENTSDDVINYGSFYSSMNSGDYLKPLI
jgi:hypothetical protein